MQCVGGSLGDGFVELLCLCVLPGCLKDKGSICSDLGSCCQ